jgi:hypothetical protein
VTTRSTTSFDSEKGSAMSDPPTPNAANVGIVIGMTMTAATMDHQAIRAARF